MEKNKILGEEIRHIDVKTFDAVPIVQQYEKMAFQARKLARAAKIYDSMLADKNCSVILCMAGSLFSAGLKQIVVDLIQHNMVDCIVSTGALIVDQDFFEGLGFKHYIGSPDVNDDDLMQMHVDRIYDTFIDEDQLRECDMTITKIADSLPPGPYSSRQFIHHMGAYLDKHGKTENSVVLQAYRKGIPIFVPAFSDCSAGFGLVYHQWHRQGQPRVTIDSVQDFLELTKVKIAAGDTGLLMLSGGVPKNFAQDVVVAADLLGVDVNLHKYAVQITLSTEEDGGLSGSTLQEAHSWGKVTNEMEQMVYSEVTMALPIIASYGYHSNNWKNRPARAFGKLLNEGKI